MRRGEGVVFISGQGFGSLVGLLDATNPPAVLTNGAAEKRLDHRR